MPQQPEVSAHERQKQAQAMLHNSMGKTGSQAAIYFGPTQAKEHDQWASRMNNLPVASAPNVTANPSHPTPQTIPQRSSELEAFINAIATQESNSNYGAVGVPTRYGTALGKYQILDSNINGPGGWDLAALDQNISAEQFLRTPQFQDAIARYKLTEYFKKYGSEGAAKAWYAGPGNAMSDSTSSQYGGPSIQGYADSVLNHMKGG